MAHLPFADRTEAGRLLAAELATRRLPPNLIVLALPRGGVPVAVEIAEALHAPLDIVVVRKLGVPWQPELAMGAIAGGVRVLDHSLIGAFHVTNEDLESTIAKESLEMKRRESLYRGNQPASKLTGQTVILVDDGLATGSTMVAAARFASNARPQELIVAVPVASTEACYRVKREVDEVICLSEPEPFLAVGEWYTDFRQVTDEQVRLILKHSHRPVAPVR